MRAKQKAGSQALESEIRFIIGPNETGKTTLSNLLTGQLRPDAGADALVQRVYLGEDESAAVAVAAAGRDMMAP